MLREGEADGLREIAADAKQTSPTAAASHYKHSAAKPQDAFHFEEVTANVPCFISDQHQGVMEEEQTATMSY